MTTSAHFPKSKCVRAYMRVRARALAKIGACTANRPCFPRFGRGLGVVVVVVWYSVGGPVFCPYESDFPLQGQNTHDRPRHSHGRAATHYGMLGFGPSIACAPGILHAAFICPAMLSCGSDRTDSAKTEHSQ